MKEIPLGNNRFAIVDDADFDFLSKFNWHIAKNSHTFYAQRKESKTRRNIYMHRMILGITNPKILCDHINHNGLDNRKENLREANRHQNRQNTTHSRHGSSGVVGVLWNETSKRYVARITANGKSMTRFFKSKDDAIQCRKQMEADFFGDFRPK